MKKIIISGSETDSYWKAGDTFDIKHDQSKKNH